MKLQTLIEAVGPDAVVFVKGDHGERIKVSSFDYTLPGHPEHAVLLIPDTSNEWARVEAIMGETLEHVKEEAHGPVHEDARK